MTTMNDLEQRILKLEQNGIPGVRDFYATSALAVLAYGVQNPENVAHYAYQVADAMMKERNNNA